MTHGNKNKVENKLLESKKLETIDVMEELRQFDMNLKYGPCIDMTRLERFERAEKFGLNPPAYIRKYLEKYPTSNLKEATINHV